MTKKEKLFCEEYVANGGNASQAYYAVYDTKNDFKPVRANKELKLTKNSNRAYQFAITETLNGDIYLVAVDALPSEAELEFYKLDVTATKLNTPVLVDSDGKAATMKLKQSGSSNNLGHQRMCYTGTRNFSFQDNTLGILSYDGIIDKDYRKTSLEINNFDIAKYGAATCSGNGTYELYYYSIQFPD